MASVSQGEPGETLLTHPAHCPPSPVRRKPTETEAACGRKAGRLGEAPVPPDPSHGLWSSAESAGVSHSVVSHSTSPRTVARQAPLSVGFSRQKYGSGWPLPPPGDLPNPGIEPGSPSLAGGFFTPEPPGKPQWPGGRTFLGLGPQEGTGAEAGALSTFPGWGSASQGSCLLLPE